MFNNYNDKIEEEIPINKKSQKQTENGLFSKKIKMTTSENPPSINYSNLGYGTNNLQKNKPNLGYGNTSYKDYVTNYN